MRGDVTIGEGILIRPIKDKDGIWIYGRAYGGTGKVTLTGDVKIELNGSDARGIYAENLQTAIELQNGWSITGRERSGTGIALQIRQITFSAKDGKIQNCRAGLEYSSTCESMSTCTLTDVEISGNRQGIVFLSSGTLTVKNSLISNNMVLGISGGDTYNSAGALMIDGATIENNGWGLTGEEITKGGVYLASSNTTSDATIQNSTISGNRCNYNKNGAGGIYAGRSITLIGNRITNNQSHYSGKSTNNNMIVKGGGVYLSKDSTLTNNTITGNTASSSEGANHETKYPKGGGVYIAGGTATLIDNTISGNTAVQGGGVCVNGGTANLINNAISGNTAELGGGVCVYNGAAILTGGSAADNTAELGGGVYVTESFKYSTSTEYNGNATVTGNCAITGNTAQLGGGVYVGSSASEELVLESAGISENVSKGDSGKSSGVYNAGRTLKMAGSRVDISDHIYLGKRDYPITLTSPLGGRSNYRIAVNTASYKLLDAVVQPTEGGYPSNAAQYLRNTTAVDAGFVLAKGTDPDVAGSGVNYIVIKRCIFVSDSGNDGNTGATPSTAYRTMAKALDAAKDGNAVIYVCGKVTASGTESWSCAAPVEIRRYTGFAIGGADAYAAYKGAMFGIPQGMSVTVGENISLISGRHTEEDTVRPTGSIFEAQGNLTFAQTTRIGGNISGANGGAIHVAQGGTVNVNGALSIEDVSGANGGAICNEGSVLVNGRLSIANASAAGDGDAVYQSGTFELKNGAALSTAGTIYLTNDAHLTLASGSVTLTEPLNLDIADPRDGRVYVRYGSSEEAAVQRVRYSLPAHITSSYLLTDGSDSEGYLQLKLGQTNVVYVDPNYTGGTQIGKVQGATADYPFDSLKAAYEHLKDLGGGLIYIVDTIPVGGNVTVGATAYQGPDGNVAISNGGVSIKRYSKPEGNKEGFTHETHTEALFVVQEGGSLKLDGVVADGHSNAVTGASEAYLHTIAPAVMAHGPIVDVQDGGTLTLKGGAQLVNNRNAQGADAIQDSGTVNVSGSTTVRGSVKLDWEKYITVTTGAETQANPLEIQLHDPSDGRVIADYSGATPAEGELNQYLLPEEVLRDYYLAIEGTQVVLKAKVTVYVDGTNGDDANDGQTPEKPVRTLEHAYELLAVNGGTIYIVNTANVTGNTRLMPGCYIQGSTKIDIESGDVRILRYSKPNAETTPDGFDVESFTGALIKVEQGATLALDGIVIDGHSEPRATGDEKTTADGVSAQAELLSVFGSLEIENGATLQNNSNTAATYGLGGAIRIYARGNVKITDGTIRSNQADMGQGIFHFGELEVCGKPNLADGQWIYMGSDRVVRVIDELELTSPLQVDFPTDQYTDGHVVAEYKDGFIPQPGHFTLGQTDLMNERKLSLVVEEQKLILRADKSFDITQDVTLYASAIPEEGKPQSVEVKLTELGVEPERLQGQTFTVESVTLPDGSPLKTPVFAQEVEDKKATAGSGYANSTVAITARPGGSDAPANMVEGQTLSFGTLLSADDATLKLDLHCANAITAADDATLTIVLTGSNGDKITLNVTIRRVPSQISATVPLVIVVRTNIDGGSVSELPNYAIHNASPMRVQVTEAMLTDSTETYDGINLTLAQGADGPGVDEYRITLKDAADESGKLTSAKDLLSGDDYHPIGTIETGRLSFVTAQAVSGLEQGVKLANIVYKLAIPTDDMTDDQTQP